MAQTQTRHYGYWDGQLPEMPRKDRLKTEHELDDPMRKYANDVVLGGKIAGSFAVDFGAKPKAK